MRIFVFVSILSAFVIAMTTSQADDLVGGWKGTWTKDGEALPVTMTFAKAGDAYSGAFDSDALQVVGIPLGDIRDTKGRVESHRRNRHPSDRRYSLRSRRPVAGGESLASLISQALYGDDIDNEKLDAVRNAVNGWRCVERLIESAVST
jgi:hypothetical protein